MLMVCIMLQACLQSNHGSPNMLVDQMVDSEATTLQVCSLCITFGLS